jgi:hypothetical protein
LVNILLRNRSVEWRGVVKKLSKVRFGLGYAPKCVRTSLILCNGMETTVAAIMKRFRLNRELV